MLKKQIIFVFAFVAGLAGLARVAYADTCTTDYGGTTTCVPTDLTIDKQVQNPSTNAYVDNLTTTDATFAPGANVTFKLVVHNASGQTFDPVTVKDVLPPYLTFVSGPGTYDSGSKTLTITENNMIAGETRTETIVAKVVAADQFPSGKSLFCVQNFAEVRALNRYDSDTAQACLQNGNAPTTLPVAGYNDLMLLLPFAGVGLSGFALLKKRS